MVQKIVMIVSLISCMMMTVDAKDSSDLKWKLSGRLHIDGGVFNNPPPEVFNSVNITEIRLGAKVSIGDAWSAKFDVGFANNKVSIKDAFIQYKYKDNYFRAGNILGPFGIYQSVSTNDLVFNTGANIAETLYAGRRMGLLYTYSRPNHYISTGVFYGTGINSLSDMSGGSNYTFRYVFRNQKSNQQLIHFGVSGLYKTPSSQPGEDGQNIKQITLASKGVTYLKAPSFIGATINDVKNQTIIGAEALWVHRRYCLQAEYLHSWIKSPTLSSDYQVKGGYLQFSYLLKGKNYGYYMIDAIPMMPTDPHSILLSIRGNITQLNSGNVTQLNNNDVKGGCQKDIGLAFGYYLNRYISGRLNYSYIWLDKDSRLGNRQFGMLQARLQFCF